MDELVPLVTDLPALVGAGRPPGQYALINDERVKENDVVVSVMSGVARKGSWSPPRRLTSVTFMGGTDLDLREALFPPGKSTINIFCLMGGVNILVPPGVNVEVRGVGIMGAFESRCPVTSYSGAPTLVVNGLALMGGVEVKEKKSKKDGS